MSGPDIGPGGVTLDASAGPLLLRRLALLIAVGVLLGTVFPLSRAATQAGVPFISYTFWYAAGGAVLLLVSARLRGAAPRLRFENLRYYVVTGLVSVALPYGVSFMVVPRLGAGLSAIFYTLAPILTYVLAVCWRTERLAWRGVGVLLGLIGALLIFVPRLDAPTQDGLGWLVLALLTPAALAVGNVYRSVAWPAGGQPLELAVGMLLAAALWIAPAMLLMDGLYLPRPLESPGDRLLVMQCLLAALTFSLYFRLQRAGPVYMSQIGNIITITGVFSGMAFFGEQHAWTTWLAIPVMIAGVLVVSQPAQSKAPRA